MKNILPKPPKLFDVFKRVPKSRSFIVTHDKSYQYGDVVEVYDEFLSQYAYLTGSNCAVISEDRESLALLLPAIETVANEVYLLPKNSEGFDEEYLQKIGVDALIKLKDCQVTEVRLFSCGGTRHDVTTFVLPTSGTTGKPKLAKYNLESLLSTTKSNIERGENFTWGLTFDINRFAGLQVYLQAISSGSTLVIPSDGLLTEKLLELFISKNVNSISGTPSFWRKVLMDPSHQQLSLRQITLGGEISSQSVLSALSKSYSNASIIHIYASTEAGVGFSVRDKLEGFPKAFLKENSLNSCKLKIEDGTLWIKSPRSCSTLVSGNLEVDREGFINTGDMVKVNADRVLFLGRKSGLINVGGNKVLPEKVEAVLEEYPEVIMARVFAKSNPMMGALVVGEIVYDPNVADKKADELKKDLLDFCRNRLEPFEVPAIVRRVDTILTNKTGKKVRN